MSVGAVCEGADVVVYPPTYDGDDPDGEGTEWFLLVSIPRAAETEELIAPIASSLDVLALAEEIPKCERAIATWKVTSYLTDRRAARRMAG